MTTTNKKVALIIAFKDFRDEEYFVPKEIIKKAGYKITTASNQLGEAEGTKGGKTAVDILVNQLEVKDYEAIVFIGGPGALEGLDNPASYALAQAAVKNNKVLAAICISPVILAKAGTLSGKKATVWSSPLDQSAIGTIKQNKATYQESDLVIDNKIITANGPAAAEKFGRAIIETLSLDSH